MSDFLEERDEEVVVMEDKLAIEEMPIALNVPHNIDDLIAQHMLNLFNRYRDTDIPGTIELKISATASSGAREIAVEHEAKVGPWTQRGEFKSPSLKTSFEKAVERYREQCIYEIKALPAS